ncbi:hypothetical protein ILUMI_22111 [Ignelater luminosus]|uniref:Uncharacterized protein n=1 Tax=Ignelater luminosus TaxID=2038154 RepID=A0A8K0CB84_IGNLU|nr:hypothetical protein ILUMI_22111 [Ignelater luminosus]
MKRTRPSFENTWIGARKYYMDWLWISTEMSLPNETGSNGYPPWKSDRPSDTSKSCVLLDHHTCNSPLHIQNLREHKCMEPLFIEEACNVKKDFICEIVQEDNDDQTKQYQITVDQVSYIFFNERKSWVDALDSCERLSMTLAVPETDRQWEMIISYMGDMQTEFDHVWLGGRWIPNEWVWLDNRSIPVSSKNKYPPWCNTFDVHEEEEDCLNLDRDSHNRAEIYGYNCLMKQEYVCQFDIADAIESSDRSVSNQYIYTPTGVTHNEAERLCRKNDSFLAIVNDIRLAQKLAMIIPRDTLAWIGGKRIANIWRWIRTAEVIPDVTNEDNYPPWESVTSVMGKQMCLAMKSGYREQPLFVEKPCKERLHYVCQPEAQELPPPDVVINYSGIQHYFYKNGVPWREAKKICSLGKLFLATVGNLGLANFLLEGMGDANSQWTSGRESLPGNWIWTTSSLRLPNEIKRGYPPWINNIIPTNIPSKCLLLDSYKNKPVFKSENCLHNHSYVCVDKIFISNDTQISVGNLTINVEDMITNIAKAKKACIDSGRVVFDFSKVTYTQLLKILEMEKVKSIWLDVVYSSEGKWVYTDTMKEFKTNISFPEKDTHSINDPKNCLTLRLTTENKLILVPSLCSDFSRIVCMSKQTNTSAPPRVEKVINDSVTIIAVLENSAFDDSNLLCINVGGEIVARLLSQRAIDFFNTLHSSYEVFWLGARFVNSTWRWNDNVPVALNASFRSLPIVKSNASSIYESSCLVYIRETNTVEVANCSKKYSTVCEKVILKCEPRQQESYLEWSPKRCTKERLDVGTVCRVKCPITYNLVGPELYVCVKGKWSNDFKPSCRTHREQGLILDNLFKVRIAKETIRSSFLFVIDIGKVHKKGFEKINYEKSLHFSKHVANTMLLGESRRVGIEFYSRTAKIVDSMESQNCYLIKTIGKLISHTNTSQFSSLRPNYYNAFQVAETFFDKNIKKGSGFIFFFAMRPDTGPIQNRTEIIRRLKAKGIVVVIITVGEEINRSQLEEMASSQYEGLQLYSFKTIKGLEAAANVLKSKAKFKTTDCTKDDNLRDT